VLHSLQRLHALAASVLVPGGGSRAGSGRLQHWH
jgi:hypothetical protein